MQRREAQPWLWCIVPGGLRSGQPRAGGAEAGIRRCLPGRARRRPGRQLPGLQVARQGALGATRLLQGAPERLSVLLWRAARAALRSRLRSALFPCCQLCSRLLCRSRHIWLRCALHAATLHTLRSEARVFGWLLPCVLLSLHI